VQNRLIITVHGGLITMRGKKTYSLFGNLLYLLVVFVFMIHSSPNSHADVFISENWDSGTPPPGFPCWESECGSNHTWHGWSETDSNHHEEGNDCELSTSIYHSAPRSLHQVRSANQYRVINQLHDITESPTKIYLRFYIYFTGNWESFNEGGESEFVHLIFTNTALSGTGFRLNLRHHVSNSYEYECSSGMFLAFQDGSNEGGSGTAYEPCFNIKDHLQEWICFEIMMDATNDEVSMWINGVQGVDEASMTISQSAFYSIILSGFSSYLRDKTWDYYIDDIVVSDSYIGPTEGSEEEDPPSAPNNVRIAE
jgi:hypothetical protein